MAKAKGKDNLRAFPSGDALTGGPERLHCAATQDVEALQVEVFLDTLAEIAQAIAQREQGS